MFKKFLSKFKFINKSHIKVLLSILIICIFYSSKTDSNEKNNIKTSAYNDLEISARILNDAKFVKGFNHMKNQDTQSKYKAIQIDIINKSKNEYLLHPNSIILPIITPTKIEKKLRSRSFLAPVLVAGAAASLLIFGLGLAYIPSAIAAVTVGASTNLVDIKRSNNKLHENIKNASQDQMHDTLIPAFESVSKVFFIKKEKLPKDKISLKLLNPKTNQYSNFDIVVT